MSAAIDDAPRDNKFDAPTIARGLYLCSGILVVINGFVFIGDLFNGVVGRCTGNNCVGPALAWGSWTGGNDDGQNAAWRAVFPLGPNQLLGLWTGVFLGILMLIIHLPGFKFSFNTRSWLHVSFFSLFTMLFGAFPYSGNLGVLVGFFMMPLCVLSFLLAFTRYRHDPTTFNLRLSHLHCGCLVDNELVLQITRILSLVAGLCVLIIGIIHIIVQDLRWCPAANFDCIGPSLRWNPSGVEFTLPGNGPTQGGWGAELFTLAIDKFMELWGPIMLGLISIGQHLNGHQITAISVSWPRVFLWYMFVALFGSFGYAGNLGILTGFLCVFVSLLALAISLGGGATTKTHLDLQVYKFSGPKTMITAGASTKDGFEVV